MLKKVLVTLKYGETKAKLILIGMIILVVSGFVLLLIGITGMKFISLCVGAVLLIAGLLTLFSFSFVEIDVDVEKKTKYNSSAKKEKPKKEKKKEDEAAPDSSTDSKPPIEGDIDFSMFEDELSDISDVAIGVGKPSAEMVEAMGMESSSEEHLITDQEELARAFGIDPDDKTDSEAEKEASDDSSDENDSSGKKSSSGETIIKKPTAKQIKARKKMLKVRRDDRRFTPIIVDFWKEVSALRVPAFVQEKGKNASIILVEGALRTELMPISEFLQVTYQKNIEENFMENYDEIKQDPDVSPVFGELLPAFYQGGSRGGEAYYCKNLYILGGKLAITPRSLRKLFNKFDFKFKVFDSLDIKGIYSDYFKMAYENRIFWTDNVITQNDYQERIRSILQQMVEDDNLKNSDFEKDTDLMVRFNLITREYADYYRARKTDRIKIRI